VFIRAERRGKTTLLTLLHGGARPSQGQIQVDASSWNASARHLPVVRRKLGIIFQDYKLIPAGAYTTSRWS
jgi:cell division transport system ATP-binding protein